MGMWMNEIFYLIKYSARTDNEFVRGSIKSMLG